MSKLHRALKVYVYVRLGLGNYLSFTLAVFNTASLVWYFAGLKEVIGFGEFLLLFFAIYFPLAAFLGYHDLKRLVGKTMAEVSPYWRRPNYFLSNYYLGSMMYLHHALAFWKLSGDDRVKECSKEAVMNHLKRLISEGEMRPHGSCFCKLAFEEGLMDEEHYEMCVKALRELE
ncbi:hypothetical protein [Ignicoccus hospitalis]|nr:hypothetical protein [Ignicoccus hospitalis]HIH90454.1 hypothetical protein [Desulfurococcaceae archaeon]